MKYTEFASLSRFYALGNEDDTSNLPDTRILLLANVFKDEISKDINKANADIFGTIFTRDLEANRREYAMPDEILSNIKTVEVKLDGSNQLRLTQFDLNSDKRPTNEANILLNFANRPKFDIYRRALWIYSGEAIKKVVGGLILRAIIYPADFTDLTDETDMAVDPSETTFGFPRQFHELLARRVSIAYKTGLDKPRPLSEKEKLYEADLAKAVGSISNQDLDSSVIMKVPTNNGQQY